LQDERYIEEEKKLGRSIWDKLHCLVGKKYFVLCLLNDLASGCKSARVLRLEYTREIGLVFSPTNAISIEKFLSSLIAIDKF